MIFNEVNELAWQAVFGEHYQGGEPYDRPEGVTAKDGVLTGILHGIDLTGKPVNRDTWVALANELEGLAMAQRTREILLYTKSCRIAGKAVVESDGRALL
jgi:hypothetical protein